REIAAEELVGGVAWNGDLDVPADELGEEVGGYHAREGLVEAAEDAPQIFRVVAEGNGLLVVLRAIALGDPARPTAILLLARSGRALGVSQGEGLDRSRRELGGQRGGEARVDTAAPEEADGHVRHEPPLDAPTHELHHPI